MDRMDKMDNKDPSVHTDRIGNQTQRIARPGRDRCRGAGRKPGPNFL